MDNPSSLPNGLVFAMAFDGKGGGTRIEGDQLDNTWADHQVTWVHADYRKEEAQAWLQAQSGISPAIAEALLSPQTRPGLWAEGDGLLLILRALNPDPTEAASEMVSVRLWIEPSRIISLRARRLGLFHDLHAALMHGRGPLSAAHLLSQIVQRLSEDLHAHVLRLEEAVDALTREPVSPGKGQQRAAIRQKRLEVIELTRYTRPQAETLDELVDLPRDWLDADTRWRLRAAAQRSRRAQEDLVALEASLDALEDDLEQAINERLNHRLYIVAIVSTVFLPLNFVASVLGMNVGGVPGVGQAWAFGAVLSGMGIIGVILAIWFRQMRWW